ncbi:MAG: hypothetical protein HQK84_11445 [Nitrospinae bacterium]|nr:hypothetical protein [Nitrospinota bacterium]
MIEGFREPEIMDVLITSKGRSVYRINKKGELREMDCIDCHNRVGHTFVDADTLADKLLTSKVVDPSLPFAKAVMVRTLKKLSQYEKKDFLKVIEKEFKVEWPHLDGIETTANRLFQAARTFLYPRMNIQWGSYRNMMGHSGREEGCFRCHNQRMRDENGVNLTQNCDSCHAMIADKMTDDEWKKKYQLPL